MSAQPAADRISQPVSLELTACPSDLDLACFVDGLLDDRGDDVAAVVADAEMGEHGLVRRLVEQAVDETRQVEV
jgi:hypothetical protein